MSIRIAHFSDIHFYHLNKSPTQFFNKRVLANFHALFSRRKTHDPALAFDVLNFLKKEKVTHLIITGDYTTSSSKKEFEMMQKYIEVVKNEGFTLLTLPGNHDVYTKHALRNNSFFSYLGNYVNFEGDIPNFNLADESVAAYKISDNWWVVMIHCSTKTPLHKSTGIFSKKIEENLTSLLEKIPSDAEITAVCHFPFEPFRYPNAHLERGDALKKILIDDPRIKVYLHGHRHKHRIERLDSLLVCDSGSISLKKHSSLNIIDLKERECQITHYQYSENTWKPTDVRKSTKALV
jgi:3',5'-cyclic AMP phosphodiesterase CpdA